MNNAIAIEKLPKEELEKKIQYFKIFLSQYPYDILTYSEYGRALCALGRHKEGIEKYNIALNLNPYDIILHSNKALAYMGLRDYVEAHKMFDIALTLNKNSALLHRNKGIVYTWQGDWKRAIVCFNIALSIEPKCEQTRFNRAESYFNYANQLTSSGDFKESVKYYDKLSLEYGSAQKFFNDKAEALKQNNNFTEAIKWYDKCISFKENTDEYVKALLEKASLYTELKRCNEAIMIYNKLINMKTIGKKELITAHEKRADACYASGKFEKYAESFKKAIEIKFSGLIEYENFGNLLQQVTKFFDHQKFLTKQKLDLNKFVTENSILTSIISILSELSHQPHKNKSPHFVRKVMIDSASMSSLELENSLKITEEINNNYWFNGTGFGNGSTMQQWDANKTIIQQQLKEDHVSCILEIICKFIECCKEKISEKIIEILDDSCVANVLFSYLQNDSILDISRRIRLYRSVLKLVHSLSTHIKLNKLLSKCKTFDLTKNMKQLFETYVKKLKYTEKDKVEEEEGLSCLLIVLNKTFESIEKHLTLSEKVQSSGSNDMNESLEKKYCEILKEFQFDSYSIVSEIENNKFKANIPYYYESLINEPANFNSLNRVKRLAQEVITISNSLPISYSSTVFVRYDEERLDVVKFMIIGPEDTPYANGCFEFDAFFPADYPDLPPIINLQTTGNQTFRFNPNLYHDGKVCLSILNTWHGRPEELWNGQTSSFLQVLVSIQSLILVSEPYFNEPGYENLKGTTVGTKSSIDYNANIIQATVKWSMLEQLKNSTSCFKDPIRKHFMLKQKEIRAQCEKWSKEMEYYINDEQIGQSVTASYVSLKRNINQLFEELNKL